MSALIGGACQLDSAPRATRSVIASAQRCAASDHIARSDAGATTRIGAAESRGDRERRVRLSDADRFGEHCAAARGDDRQHSRGGAKLVGAERDVAEAFRDGRIADHAAGDDVTHRSRREGRRMSSVAHPCDERCHRLRIDLVRVDRGSEQLRFARRRPAVRALGEAGQSADARAASPPEREAARASSRGSDDIRLAPVQRRRSTMRERADC